MKAVVTGIFLGASLLSTQVMAEEKASAESKDAETASKPIAAAKAPAPRSWYIGADVFGSANTFEISSSVTPEEKFDNDSTGIKLKVGHVLPGGWGVQVYFQSEVFDDQLYGSSDELIEVGIDGLKVFKLKPKVSAFVQAGVGYGQLDLKEFNQDSANVVSLKIGGGVMYSLTPDFEVVAGLDIQSRDWASVSIVNTTFDISDTSNKLYIGGNYYF